MQPPVWLKYCSRHKVADADRDFAAEVMAGIDQRRGEACAAMVDMAAAVCRTNGTAIDSYDLGRMAERMRNADG